MEENNEIKQTETEKASALGLRCIVCRQLLDANRICWNTNYKGLGINCPLYGEQQ